METLIFRVEILAQKWALFMLASSVQLGLFIALIAVLTFLFRKQSAKFLYWIWLIGLLKILIPPSIKLPVFLSQSRFMLDNTLPAFVFPEIQFGVLPAPQLSSQGYLFLIWAVVLVMLFAFWIIKIISFNNSIIRSCYEITDDILSLHQFDARDQVRFFTGPDVRMPFTKGFFSAKIYLPQSALSWSRDELKALIFHELAHVKRKDMLIIAFQNIIQVLYFFHPMVWLANMQIARYREKACDDFAILAMQGKHVEYGKLLLKSVDQVVGWKPMPSLTTYFHQSKKFLIHRFEYILNRREFIMTKLNSVQKLVLFGLIALGIVFSCEKKEQPVQPQQVVLGNNIVIDLSKETLQAGLVDSQKVDYDTPPMPIGGFEALKDYLLFPEFGEKQGSIMNVYINYKGEVYGLQYMSRPAEAMKTIADIELFALNKFESKLGRSLHKFKWTPATKDGKPISAWITLPIQYTLKIQPEEIISPSEVPPPPPPMSPEEEVSFFVAYDEPPAPIGGFKAIQQNLVYPEIARKAGVEGTVTVQARISAAGKVINTRILVPLGENNGCNEAAVAAIKAVKWQPAKAKGQPVSVWVSIPVRFKLSGDSKIVAEKITDELKARMEELPPPPPPEGAEEYYVPYDKPPEPIGGFAAIQKNLVYPDIARKAGVEGTVTIQARIDENGEITDTRILVPLGNSGCNEAAIEAIKSVKWKPAKYQGKGVAVWVSVPVRFKLQ